MHVFVHGHARTTLEIVLVPSYMVKDPFLCLKKRRGPTVDLTTVRKGLSISVEEEEEEAPLTPKKKRRTSAATNLKQKVKTSPEKS